MSGKRMFEFVEGSSSKFWEVWRDGNEVRTRYGRIGSDGQTTVKSEADEAKAQKLYDKLIKEKTGKGYVEKTDGGGGEAPAPSSSPATAAKKTGPKIDAAPLIKKIEAKAKKAGKELPDGASAADWAALEKTLGFALPDDMKAWYLAHDGGPADDDSFADFDGGGPRELLSLERIAGEWKIWKDLLDKGDFAKNDHGTPGKGVQQKWWIPEWVPVTYDGAGNHHVVDVAPGKGGVVGQVLDFWHDNDPRNVVAPSFLQWLASDKMVFGDAEDDDDDEEGDDEEQGDEEEGGFVRYEVDEKFWAIQLEGSSHTVKYGKIGTNGAEKTKDFDDAAAAKKDHDKLVKEKTGKGYQRVGGGPPAASAAKAPAKKLSSLSALMQGAVGYRAADFDADDRYVFTCCINGDGHLAVHAESTANPMDFVVSAAAIETGTQKINIAQGGATLGDAGVDEKTPSAGFPPFLLSRSLFAALKAGETIAWPTILTGDGTTVDVTKTKAGSKSISVNGKKQTVKTIEASGDDVQLVLLDDAQWPLVLVNEEGDECGWWLLKIAKDLSPDDIEGDGEDEDDEDEDEDEDEGGEGGGWRRFEMDEKFWAISLNGDSHTVKFGKQGTDGQEKTKTFDDEAAAKKDYEKLIKEKTGKGYEEVDGDD